VCVYACVCMCVCVYVCVCVCARARARVAGAFIFRFLCTSISIWVFKGFVEDDKCRRWRLHCVYCLEMKRLNDILDDLLPFRNKAGGDAPYELPLEELLGA
jgi:hypothetical protein